MKRLAFALLAACHGSSSAPARAHDDAAPAPAPPSRPVEPPHARRPLPDAERAALTGTIDASVGREGAFRIVAFDPRGKDPPKPLTPDDASYFPVPGAARLAIETVDQGDEHVEQLVTYAPVHALGPASSHVRNATATADGKTIVVEADTQSFRDLYRVDPATGALTRLTSNAEGNFEPSLAPDGARLAFTSSRDGDAEIYAMPTAGGAQTRLTFFHKDDWGAQWSPDGAWIAFLSDREGAPRVFLIKPDGTGTRAAHTGDVLGEEQEPRWSPDGKRIAYTVSTRDGASEVWVIELATGEAHRVSEPGARDEVPTWAPDSAHLVYVSTRDRRIDLWIARADGSAESRLTDTPEEEWIPRWRP